MQRRQLMAFSNLLMILIFLQNHKRTTFVAIKSLNHFKLSLIAINYLLEALVKFPPKYIQICPKKLTNGISN